MCAASRSVGVGRIGWIWVVDRSGVEREEEGEVEEDAAEVVGKLSRDGNGWSVGGPSFRASASVGLDVDVVVVVDVAALVVDDAGDVDVGIAVMVLLLLLLSSSSYIGLRF